MSEKELTFDIEVKAAQERVAAMDAMDGVKDRQLLTIFLALKAGLQNPGTGAQFDAFVMMGDIVAEHVNQ